MKGRRGISKSKTLDDFPCRQTLRPLLHQQTKDAKARVLRQPCEGLKGCFHFHISNYTEILAKVKSCIDSAGIGASTEGCLDARDAKAQGELSRRSAKPCGERVPLTTTRSNAVSWVFQVEA